jgi:hypothetical protein
LIDLTASRARELKARGTRPVDIAKAISRCVRVHWEKAASLLGGWRVMAQRAGFD